MCATTVTDLMTEPVLTVDQDERPGDIATAMLDAEIKSVVVIDDDCHPVGILTSTDYVTMTANGTDPYGTTVAEQMTRDIVTVTGDTSVTTAATAMIDHDINHLPVVGDDGMAIGILSTTDLASSLANTAAEE
jgi:CBS domain-containing protein